MALTVNSDPTKRDNSDRRAPRLAQMLDRWGKEDPPTRKKLPVEADVPEYLVKRGLASGVCPLTQTLGDLVLIAFYYLLRMGEYTMKVARGNAQRTVQFKMEDITFFAKNERGELRQCPRDAADNVLLSADGATLKLDNQKNGWKGVCIHQEWNGEKFLCAVRALGRRYIHIWHHT